MTTVNSSTTTTLPSNVDDLVLTGSADINGTGNTLNNTITGNAGANVLDGRTGADTLIGGEGNDTYVVDNAGDRVIEQAGEGTDTVQASVSYTLTDNVENLTLTGSAHINGTGNALDNVILGNGGNNILSGLDGNDTLVGGNGADTLDGGAGDDDMQGGAGNDTYVVDASGDRVTEAAGAGTDTVRASIDYTLGDNLENLVLGGTADLNGNGNQLDNVITGNGGVNTLIGGAGNDTLNGGLGADRMEGGVGDDTYVVDDLGDRVIEAAGEGTDTVQSSITTTLSEHVENLSLTGTAAIDGTGNALDNVIVGNAGANQLFGGAGNDTLDGGAGADLLQGDSGDDTYIVDNVLDTVVELEGGGTDKVIAGVNYTLAANVENLTLSGGASIGGAGNELDNVITGNNGHNLLSGLDGNDVLVGNGGNDTLDGGSGADLMQGGIGDDTYVVEQDGDMVVEAADAGNDTVRSSIDYTLVDNVENLVLTGVGDLNGTGNALNNVMTGNAGNNTFSAGAGNDTVNAGEGNDLVFGGEGNDTLGGDAGDDILFGEAGNDILNGGLGADRMEGGAGDDVYFLDNDGDLVVEAANAGTDLVNSSITTTLTDHVENLTLTGSADIDGTGNALDNVINGNLGANVLDGRAGNDTINGNLGADRLIGGEGDDTLNGDAGNDYLQGDSGNDLLNGGSGLDVMVGGTGNDTYVVDNAGDLVSENAGEGLDLVQAYVDYTLTGDVENLTLLGATARGTGNELDNLITGNYAANVLYGMAGEDTLAGLGGNDTLDGGLGADLMQGGTGDDTYIVDNAGDRVEELAGQGTDTVRSTVDYTLTANVENLTLLGSDNLVGNGNALNNIIIGNSGDNTTYAGDGADTVHAGAGKDLVYGGNGNDVLNGEAGDDTLFGDAGNDTINGGLGADAMAGGAGDDSFVVDDAGDLVVELAGEGTDLVNSSITYTLTDHVENLTLTGSADIDGTGNELANIINGNAGANVLDGRGGNDTINGNLGADLLIGGEGDDILNGDGGDDRLQGDAGNDLLNGGAGADTMLGGSGDDTYVVDNAGDRVLEAAGEGVDTVQSSITTSLAAKVENLVLTGSAATNGSGNELDNVITGNNANNLLSGEDGDDTLVGNGGDDVLDGGSGADTMLGGIGNDTYVVENAQDVVVEAAGAGTDTVRASLDYTLGANVENLVLTGSAHLAGTGNALNNTISGNAGNNLIDGGAGTDTMLGGAGDDTYIVDASADVIVEAAGAGHDTAWASASYTLAANVEDLVLTGVAPISGTGNAQDNTITGNGGDNLLSGMAGNDLLIGGAGNDTLDGGSGADTMLGGTGNDSYRIDEAGDVVVERSGEGNDTVVSSIDYTLGANLENLTLAGSATVGTGNELDNIITGNGGNNLLSGAGGNDTLIGGAGDDTYLVDTGDTIVEAAGGGNDTVHASHSYTLGANLENLVLLGDADLDGSGNALNNTIRGNAGANRLDGGLGADTLLGGAGDDTYIVDHAGDLVVEAAGEGVDTVLASAHHALAANVEHLVLAGSANLNGTGNAGANSITGNGGANILDGGAGDDVLLGGAGNDTLLGGDGQDLLDGGLDADLMQGGRGDDTYLVDHAGDTIVEAVDGGTDTVLAGVSHVLAANVEHLVLTGSAKLAGTGNALDNVLLGNGGDNQLSGMDGNDVLSGGAGNDLLLGGAGDDTYLFGIGDGTDRIVDAQGKGILKLRDGLTQADLLAEQSGSDLVLTIAATGDSVVLVDWLAHGEGVTEIVFGDGSTLDRGGMAAMLNAAPVAADDGFAVYEDGGLVHLPVTQLLANDTDPDAGDVLTVIAVGASGIGATVGLDGNGQLSYDIGDRFQELAQGEVVNDSFTYTITDELGETSTAVVNVQIIGTNDAAVTNADTAQASEDGVRSVSGNVLANDSDIDRGTVLQVAAPGSYAGAYGTLVIAADGSYTYSLDDAATQVQGLNAGEVVTDRFAYVATDGIEGVASTLEVTITGSNDAPVVSADSAQASEDGQLAASGNVLANDRDPDAGTELAVAAPGVYAGTYGSLTLAADGSYTYRLDNGAAGVQALAAGQSVVDSFSYAATDGQAAVQSTLDITITGSNDAPVLAADTAQAVEDAAPVVSGNLLDNDSDIDAGTSLTVSAGTSQGRYGSLALEADGSYVYQLDSDAVQSMGRDARTVERFAYGVSDGMVSGSSTLEIAVAGTNDAPIVVAPLADRQLTFNKAFSFALPADSFKDIDQGDTLTYSATLADGSELPSWLKFDAASGTFAGTTPKQVGSIEVRVTATDQVGATGSTAGSLSASDVFTLSVSHGNEGVGNGEDAAPGGHDGNQNDGPGTAPGNPGAKGGKNFGLSVGISASNGVAAIAVTATAESSGQPASLGVPTLLSASKMVEFNLPASSLGNTTSAQSFGAWLKVDLAVSQALAEKKSLAWLDERSGADTGVLAKATAGFLGSTTAFGGAGLSLAGSAGVELKGFEGLGKGTKALK